MSTSKDKICVAMSGGVDSSTSGHILMTEYKNVIGVTFKMHDFSASSVEENAKKSCDKLGIPHFTIDARDVFSKFVINPFIDEYENGNTPNPCVMCNQTVKFPLLFDFADSQGCFYCATGHYAKIVFDGNRYLLKKASDISKDQSYMLWGLKRHQLERLVFPLGDITKSHTREIAKEAGIPSASQKDSQDICFVPGGDYVDFIKRYRNKKIQKGFYVSQSGEIIAENKGHICYTVGQRKGLGISLGHHVFVLGKNVKNNTVTLGSEESLYKRTVKASNINLISVDSLEKGERLTAKIRYGKNEMPALITQTGEDEITAVFDESVRAPASGQSIVFYDGDTVVGGGVIINE